MSKNHPNYFRPVSRRDPILASEHNQILEAFNFQFSGVDRPRQLPNRADSAADGDFVDRFQIETIAGDYLVCVRLSGLDIATVTIDGVEVEDRVNVARPYLLRTSLESHNSVTFVYTDDTTRTASASGEDDETQVIVPAYVEEDEILAMRIPDGTGVITDDDRSVEWVDLNFDARAWAKQAE